MATTYKILSIDDGGTWAPLLQTVALKEVFGGQMLGHDVLKQFQLVAASGGGVITLAALLLNKSLATTAKDWSSDIKWRQEIFAPRRWLHREYSVEDKRLALQEFLGEIAKTKMSALPGLVQRKGIGRSPHFQICAYDADRKRAEFFRSLLNSKAASTTAANNDPMLVDVVHAATTSPMSPFDGPAIVGNTGFWVGAVAGLYNPIGAAVTEALANGEKPVDIHVLSIGSGTVRLPKRKGRRSDRHLMLNEGNYARDKNALMRTTLNDPPDSATFVAHVALGEDLPPSAERIVSGSVVRMCPVVRPTGKPEVENWAAPAGFTIAEFERLTKVEKTSVDRDVIDLVRRLGEKWILDEVDNQAIRVNSHLDCEVGHARFTDAKMAWRKLTGYVPPVEAPLPSQADEPRAA